MNWDLICRLLFPLLSSSFLFSLSFLSFPSPSLSFCPLLAIKTIYLLPLDSKIRKKGSASESMCLLDLQEFVQSHSLLKEDVFRLVQSADAQAEHFSPLWLNVKKKNNSSITSLLTIGHTEQALKERSSYLVSFLGYLENCLRLNWCAKTSEWERICRFQGSKSEEWIRKKWSKHEVVKLLTL